MNENCDIDEYSVRVRVLGAEVDDITVHASTPKEMIEIISGMEDLLARFEEKLISEPMRSQETDTSRWIFDLLIRSHPQGTNKRLTQSPGFCDPGDIKAANFNRMVMMSTKIDVDGDFLIFGWKFQREEFLMKNKVIWFHHEIDAFSPHDTDLPPSAIQYACFFGEARDRIAEAMKRESVCFGENGQLSREVEYVSKNSSIVITRSAPRDDEADRVDRTSYVGLLEERLARKIDKSMPEKLRINRAFDAHVIFAKQGKALFDGMLLENFAFLRAAQFRRKFLEAVAFPDADTSGFHKYAAGSVGQKMREKAHSLYGKLEDGRVWEKRRSKKMQSITDQYLALFPLWCSLTNDDLVRLFVIYQYRCDDCGKEVFLEGPGDGICYQQCVFERIEVAKPLCMQNMKVICFSCDQIGQHKNFCLFCRCDHGASREATWNAVCADCTDA